jgi:putative glutamine amidotransferase
VNIDFTFDVTGDGMPGTPTAAAAPAAPRPLIGLTSRPDATAEHTVIAQNYADQIIKAGGIPVALPFSDAAPAFAQELVARLDGVLFTGGQDIDEKSFDGAAYDPATSHELYETSPRRDAFEAALIAACWEHHTPVLGVCRGCQVMNVAMGGTLVRDVSEQPQAAGSPILQHGDRTLTNYHLAPCHHVNVEADSLLCDILGLTSCEVNSLHHLCVATPAPAAHVVARASDGTPEAIEFRDRPFFLGVQWHPEIMDTQPALFSAFVAAAAAYAAAKTH